MPGSAKSLRSDDPLIREKALGGPDTAARSQTVWQVRLLRVTTDRRQRDVPDPEPPSTCSASLPHRAEDGADAQER